MLERDAQRTRAIQVGMLMRAYRESFPLGAGGRGLTQEELLRRMAAVDGDYVQRYSHTTVSRWESGATRPSRERLAVFGKALNLSASEVAGLMSLAGFGNAIPPYPDDEDEMDLDAVAPYNDRATASTTDQLDAVVNHSAVPSGSGFFRGAFPTVLQGSVSCLVPALATFGGAYLLASWGWNETWMPITYIGAVVGVRLASAFLRMANPYDLCEFLCISLFVLLTTPLLQGAALNMDHYGFYSIGEFGGTPIPYMLALLVNLALSTVAAMSFFALWNWQYGTPRHTGNPGRRAALVVVLPVGFVFATMAVITNTGILLQLGVALAVLSGACIILLLVRDSTVAPNERDRRFLLWAILIVGMVLTTIGAATMMAIYFIPNVPAMLLDHNSLLSWNANYDDPGFSPEDTLHRFDVGYLWHATATFVYMVFVVGGNLIAAAYRWGSDPPHRPGSSGPTLNPAEATPGPSMLSRIGASLSVRFSSIWRSRSGPD